MIYIGKKLRLIVQSATGRREREKEIRGIKEREKGGKKSIRRLIATTI